MKTLLRSALYTALLAALILGSSSPASALQSTMPPTGWQKAGPHVHAESVFDALIQGKNTEAFTTLFSTGRYSKDKIDQFKFEFFRIMKKQGKPYGYEKVIEHRAGTSSVHLRYVLLFRSVPMTFDLYYYNVDKGWLLKTYSISTDIKKVFAR